MPPWPNGLRRWPHSFVCVYERVRVRAQPRYTSADHKPYSLSMAALGTGRSTNACSVWADSARYISTNRCSYHSLGRRRQSGDGEEVSSTVTMPAYRKMANISTCTTFNCLTYVFITFKNIVITLCFMYHINMYKFSLVFFI